MTRELAKGKNRLFSLTVLPMVLSCTGKSLSLVVYHHVIDVRGEAPSV